MATPKKTAQGTWRIQIEVSGTRDGATFQTAREARDWAAKRTTELRALASGKGGTVKTLDDALARYAEEVTPSKRGWSKELVRIKAFRTSEAHRLLPRRKTLSDISATDLATWRDARLKVNARGSVLRDMNLLSDVFNKCGPAEWGWITTHPLKEVRRPQNPDHRERLISEEEIAKVLEKLGESGGPVRTVSQAVGVCFRVALETGMRAGELCGLTWARVMGDYVILHTTKNGKPRQVALTPEAKALIERMQGWDSETVFGVTSQSLDALFRKARNRAELSGFTFHDSRHTAATRLARRIQVLDLCRMFGWSDPKRAMIYYNASAADIARVLASPALPLHHIGQ
jgi:integrase